MGNEMIIMKCVNNSGLVTGIIISFFKKAIKSKILNLIRYRIPFVNLYWQKIQNIKIHKKWKLIKLDLIKQWDLQKK